MTNETPKIKEKKVFSFVYRGISVEINNWKEENSYDGKTNHWTYYLFLNLSRFTDEKLARKLWIQAKAQNPKSEKPCERRKYHGYSKISFLNSIDFHGGITYYSKLYSHYGEKMIQIGCDYDHLYDNPDHETIESVKNDAIRSIDDFYSKTEYLLMCQGNGELVKESEGIYYQNCFYSLEYAKNTEWYVKYLAEKEKD